MTMSHHTYQHPSPGPSYYPGSPVYGNHSPGPRPNFYAYPTPHYQHLAPARGSHRGGHVNSSYNSRGSHHYHPTYHPSPQAPPYPVNGPQLNVPVFTPSWQSQSPISPLPKQLSMPLPPNVRPYYDSSRVPSAQPSSTPVIGPSEQPSTFTPAHPTPASNPSDITPEIPAHLSTTLTAKPVVQWAIWSRRPHDPSQAPGIIISPKARPPPDIVQQALDLKTPPPSPPFSPPPRQSLVTPVVSPEENAVKIYSDDAANSQTNSSVPSSAATESEETPTVPGSPVSSHTSVSVMGTPVKDSTEVHPSLNEADSDSDLVSPPSVTPSSAINPALTAPTSDTAVISIETVEPDATTPAAAIVAPIDSATPQLSQPIVADTPPPPPPPPKKSWASLLRSSSSSSPSSLPTSSVVGFSIPAASQAPTTAPVPLSRKSELLNLLTSFPAPTPAGAGPISIRPRGLVNNGNMCFANSVLQVLVYCLPFHRLFSELGRLLASDGANSKDNITNNAKKVLANGSTLVNATSSFLQEFLDINEQNKTELSRTGVNNSSGSGVKGGGKGKEKEFKDEKSDNWDESFLPSYVYDVMKTKKRFDTMRGGHQEDAEEFFGFYLDTLEEELLSILHSINPPRQGKGGSTASVEEKEVTPPEDDGWFEVGRRNRTFVTRTIKSAESPITRIFGGKFKSTLRASGQKDSVIVEDWRSLRLDIQHDQVHTIQEALSYLSNPQPVQVTHSTKPGIIVEAHQQVLIEALPPVLVLHIKRFHYDTTVGGVVKIAKHVRYGPELEIPADLMVSAARKAQPVRYKLFGALYHHGQSASGGHYTLDVLHPTRFPGSLANAKPREGWIRMDDELVSDVRPEDVFRTPEQDDTRCAYLLFYRRI